MRGEPRMVQRFRRGASAPAAPRGDGTKSHGYLERRLRVSHSVAFVAAPYGFGPSSKAMAISSCLPRSLRRVFVGQGPSLAMARRSNEFSSCMHIDFRGSTSAAEQMLMEFDALVFVNSARFITSSLMANRPTILVETLAWLRSTPPKQVANLRGFFVQRFFDHPLSSALETAPNLHLVGPIVPRSIARAAESLRTAPLTRGPIVHCGGLFSPMMVEGACDEFVAQTLGALRNYCGPIRAVLPPHAGEILAAEGSVKGDLSLVECSSLDAQNHIAGSEFALTTTGIEFTYESILLGVPTLFLPPFNASQRFQVDYHERVCRESVPFDVGPAMHLDFERLHEATMLLQRSGSHGVWRRQFEEIGRFLAGFTPLERRARLDQIREKQQRMVRGLDLGGAGEIASRVLKEVGLEVTAS